ncbi:MAG: hypothetical protein LBL58_09405 [Tannerellaceae bacterium]|jgi:hypothetical protein|nr:hypothetical protein [Tannerellaceae bacterium]
MKRIILSILISLTFTVNTLQAQDKLQQEFINPPSSAKARTWWHWLNGNITKEGITADLEAMKQVGIQEAQIFNADMGYPDGPITFLSNEWLELVEFAALEAKRLGLELGIHNGAGWSLSGGPWITPEYAMQTLVFTESSCEGGKLFKENIPQPFTRLNYYKDIAVLAFPRPQSNERVDDLDIKTLSGRFRNHLEPDTKQIPKSALIDNSKIVDLTSLMSEDGSLEWKAPVGEWIILRLGYTPTGAKNHPAVTGGRGLECDKMNKKAVDVHWKNAVKPVIEKLGSLINSTLTNCILDSYEAGYTNWTAGFEKEFMRFRGYDCRGFLPALAGYYVESGEVTERFLWDFRQTVGDLMAENYYGYFRELCHQHKLKLSIEPYWGPFNSMQVGEKGDIVMCEFWSGDLAFFDSPKFVASIAHLEGNPIVGAEAFTGNGGWLNHPATIKSIGDRAWAEGVTRFIFHTYAHQPWNEKPGVTFGNYGFDLNRLNTWWEQGKAYMDYIGRSQFLLQQGKSVADVLVFTGESSPNDALLMPEIKALGYDYDLIGVNKLASLKVENGFICNAVGGKYRILVLPETDWMTPEVLLIIEKLVESGATIIGTKPLKSPSLRQYPQCDETIARLSKKLWDTDRIKDNEIVDVLKKGNFPPDFSPETTACDDINFIHRRIAGDADIYFVTNSKKESSKAICRFRVVGKQPELWNPITGEIGDISVWNENKDGTTSIPLQFDTEGSVFIVFRKAATEHICSATMELNTASKEMLPDLQIIKAEYGTFLPKGLVDVTESVANSVRDNKLNIHAGSHLSLLDPAQGYIKELRLEVETGGNREEIRAIEGEPVNIQADNGTYLKIIKAVYGKFDKGIHRVPSSYPIYDVTEQIRTKVSSGIGEIMVDGQLVGDAAKQDQKIELRITYSTEGTVYNISVPEGQELRLTRDVLSPIFEKDGNTIIWKTPYPGKMTYQTSSNKTKTIQVKSIPDPVVLTGSWDVSFSSNQGAPAKATFDKLTSWTTLQDDGIRYFSGTATYRKQFKLPKKMIREGHSLELDLGSVKVIAEVIVNGKNLGILWKAPFRINLDNVVHEGLNDLEVRITNLWPNRLIGDEYLSGDFEWNGWQIKQWPEWLLNNTPRSSKRTTFATWKHWSKDSLLQPSGLLGPVVIRPYVCVIVLE